MNCMNLSPHWASPRRQYLLNHAEGYRYQPALASARSTRRDRKKETFASRQEVNERVRQRKAKDVHPGRSLYIHGWDQTLVSRELEVPASAVTEASARLSPKQDDTYGVAKIFPGPDEYKDELERVTGQAYERVHYTAVKSGTAVASEFGALSRSKGGFWQRIAYGGRTKEAEAAPLVDFADPMDINSRDVLYPEVMTRLGLHAKSILHGHGEQQLASQSRGLECPLPKVVHEPLQPGKDLHDSLHELSRDLLSERGGMASLKDHSARAQHRQYANGTHPDALADRYRKKQLQHQRALADTGFNPDDVTELLRRIFSTADRVELLELAPKIMDHCFQVRKEDTLQVALRFGETARAAQNMGETEQCKTLQEAALALIFSVASRGRDVHGPELLVDALVALQEVGIVQKIYLDMLLSQIHSWSQRESAEFPKELAHRAATALSWASAALTESNPGSGICLAAGSRKAVADIREALKRCEAVQIDMDLLQVLEDLQSGAAQDPQCLRNTQAVAEEPRADPDGEMPRDFERLTTIGVLESEVVPRAEDLLSEISQSPS